MQEATGNQHMPVIIREDRGSGPHRDVLEEMRLLASRPLFQDHLPFRRICSL